MSQITPPQIDNRNALMTRDKDKARFLLKASLRRPDLLDELAAEARLAPGKERLTVVHTVRDCFEKHSRVPQACKIAGMREPILDV